MNDQKGPPRKNFEHSRYTDWRPSHRDEGRRRRRSRYYYERKRGSVFGFLFRLILWVVLFLAVVGPGFDFANGLAKAPEGGCVVRVVVDGDTLVTGCPDGAGLPGEIAGYDAPDLFRPRCMSEIGPAIMASLELRKALVGAGEITLVAADAPVPAPVPVPGETPEAPEVGAEAPPETGAETDAAPEVPEPVAPAAASSQVRVLVDGADVADLMLASGRVAPPGEHPWCQ